MPLPLLTFNRTLNFVMEIKSGNVPVRDPRFGNEITTPDLLISHLD